MPSLPFKYVTPKQLAVLLMYCKAGKRFDPHDRAFCLFVLTAFVFPFVIVNLVRHFGPHDKICSLQ
jgi:hypothetical protein